MRRRVASFCLAALAWIVAVAPALAHATLLRSSPEANASLDQAPLRVDLYFSETVESSFSSIQVLDAIGARVDAAPAQLDPSDGTHLSVALKELPKGVYTVSWRVLSAADGHVTSGAFPFAVGVTAIAMPAPAPSSSAESFSWGEAVSRALLYLGAALLGAGLFLTLVWEPVARARSLNDTAAGREQRRRQALLNTLGYILAITGSAFGLLAKAGQLSDAALAWPWSPALAATLVETRFGLVWLARLVALMVALATSYRRGEWRPTRTARVALLAWGLLVAMNSHAASEADPVAPILADWAHLIGAALWIGGLVAFVVALLSLRSLSGTERLRATALLIPRFSALAMACVGTLVVTGAYAAALRVGSWPNLIFSTYGQVLAVKLALVAPMIGIGAVHVLRIRPGLQQAVDRRDNGVGLLRRFQGLVRLEVALGAAALATVGLLTSAAPALPPVNAPGFNATALADDLTLQLNVNPGSVGVNQFTLTVLAYGRPAKDVTDVVLRFTPASGDLAPSEAKLTYEGDGRFALTGAYLSLAEPWKIRVAVRRIGFYDTFATFELPPRAAAPQTAAFVIDVPRAQVAAGLLILLAAGWLATLSALGWTRRRWMGLGLTLALLLLLSSYLALARTTPFP